MQSEQVNELSAGLAKAQGSMKAAAYNRINPHFKSRYADLAAVWEAIREPLSTNGLSVTQTLEPINGVGFYLRTTLYHTSGQWVSSMYPLPTEAPPQQLGSALTYARRYSLSSIVGIASDEDDDANTAQKGPGSRNVMQAAQPKGGAAMALKPLAQDLNDEIPDFADAAPATNVVTGAASRPLNFADGPEPSAEGVTAERAKIFDRNKIEERSSGDATTLKLQLLYSAARAEAMKGDAALQAWFKTRSKEDKEELRKIKAELVALYPK